MTPSQANRKNRRQRPSPTPVADAPPDSEPTSPAAPSTHPGSPFPPSGSHYRGVFARRRADRVELAITGWRIATSEGRETPPGGVCPAARQCCLTWGIQRSFGGEVTFGKAKKLFKKSTASGNFQGVSLWSDVVGAGRLPHSGRIHASERIFRDGIRTVVARGDSRRRHESSDAHPTAPPPIGRTTSGL